MTKILLNIFIFLTAVSSSAEVLILNDVLESTKKNYPLIIASKQELAGSKGEALSAEGAFDVQLRSEISAEPAGYYDGSRVQTILEQPTPLWGSRFFTSYALSNGSFPDYEGKQVTNNGGEVRAGFEIPILRDGAIDRRRANIQRSNLAVEISNFNLRQRLIEVERAASNSYYEWVAANSKLEILNKLLNVSITRSAQFRFRVAKGDLPAFDLQDNLRSELQRKSQLVSAQRVFRQAGLELSLYLRDEKGEPKLPTNPPTKLPTPLFENFFSHDEYLAKALSKRPELKKLLTQKEQNKIESKLQKNQLIPKLDLYVATSKDLGGGSYTREEAELDVGLKIDFPLQTRVAAGRLKVAEAKIQELAAVEKFLTDRIYTEVQDALISIEFSKQRVKILGDEIKLAYELENGEREKLLLGDSNLLFVNLREQTSAEAAVREVDAQLDYLKGLVSLRAVIADELDQ